MKDSDATEIRELKYKPGDGEEKRNIASNLARLWQLNQPSKEPAQIVSNIEQEEASHWYIKCFGPGTVLWQGGLNLQGDGGEAAQCDQEAN